MDLNKMRKKILTTILLSALNCAIAVVKEIESCDEITIDQGGDKNGKDDPYDYPHSRT